MASVLLVADDVSASDVCRRMLSARLVVVTARTGKGAMQIVRQGNVNAVVSTLALPDMTGLELLQHLRSTGYCNPFILTAIGPPASVDGERMATRLTVDISVALLGSFIQQSDSQCSIAHHHQAGIDQADDRVLLAMDLVERRFTEPRLSSRSVAGDLGVSHEYFCRLVKMHTGRSFGHRLHRTRVREASRLLRYTQLSVKEIAAAVGYQSTQQLDRQFNRYASASPMMFRRLLKHPSVQGSTDR
jgi:YesN/AraC family two-component response regulator